PYPDVHSFPTRRSSDLAGELLEWAEFAGNRYGTPRSAVIEHLEAGVPTLLEIDLQGARQVRESMPDALLVFLAPPSWEELERRLDRKSTRLNSSHVKIS